MSAVSEDSLIDRGRNALARHQWRDAFDLLSQADDAGELDAGELALLADAAWWTGQLPKAIEARERAYAVATRAGDAQTAVETALGLARENMLRSANAVAHGWLTRAERLLATAPDGPAHGWLAGIRSFYATVTGQSDLALGEAERAYEIGLRLGDRDLEVFGLSEKGAALLVRGEIEAGLAAVDEATAAAISGEIDPATAGGVCCTTIETCRALGDWRRAAEWTEAQDRWARREHLNGYPGMCRLFRSDIKRLRGAWLEAETEARKASDELRGFVPAAVGQAYYQIGQIRLLRGDLDGSEEALLQGHGFGRDPEPTMSLLKLRQGNVEAAHRSIGRALSDPVTSPSWGTPSDSELYRLTLLPAQVEIAIAAGDLDTARTAADELAAASGRFNTVASRASAAVARGSVLLAEGDAAGATRELRLGARLWAELDAPYEAARARSLMADALAAEGAADAAALELHAALDAFEQLGAVPDVRHATENLRKLPGGAAALAPREATRVQRAFMFTDIVDSTGLAERLGDGEWNRLLRWHDATVRGLADDLGGEEIKRTGDGFFLAFRDADAALDCAVAIQRAFAKQPEDRLAPLAVRIGIHWAEATSSGLDYIGSGVNQAARIAMVAAASEILASASTLAVSREGLRQGERRVVELRGISAPVEVVSVGWA
jgi:class 3 adenylate cyclase